MVLGKDAEAMATEVTDILTLADARIQLGVDDGIPDVDTRVIRALTSAVGYIEKETGVPLIEKPETFVVSIRGNDLPAILPRKYIKSVDEVRYWQSGQEMREEPSGTVEIADLGRMEEITYRDYTLVWPPAGGWPMRLYGSEFRFGVTMEYELNRTKDEHLRQAVILMTRVFYDAPDRFAEDFAVRSLVAAWKY